MHGTGRGTGFSSLQLRSKSLKFIPPLSPTRSVQKAISSFLANNAPFPNGTEFIHYGPVSQQELTRFYAAAHMLVLPSREDGFGVVLSQALSSGLPLVCTDRTGGPDLAKLPGLSRLICIVRSEDPLALRLGMEQSLRDTIANTSVAPITEAERQMLSWKSYALRDLQFMRASLRMGVDA